MQFTKAIALFSLVSIGLAAAVPEAEANLVKRDDLGCPGDDLICSDYCKSIGRNGGSCGGFAWQVCQCNEKV